MGTRISYIWAVTGLFLFIAEAQALEVGLTYKRHSEENPIFLPHSRGQVQKTTECPEGDWKLPKLASKQPVYGIVEIGASRRLLVLDRSTTDQQFYDKVYLDSDGDRNLIEEKAVIGKVTVYDDSFMDYRMTAFPAIDCEVLVDGKQMPYSLAPSVSFHGDYTEKLTEDQFNQQLSVGYSVNCTYTGEFDLDGKTYRVCLSDNNGNGRFTEPFGLHEPGESEPYYSHGDQFYLTARENFDYLDGVSFPNRISVGGQVFDMSADIARKKLKLTPVKVQLAPLKLSMSVTRMTLFKADDKTGLFIHAPEREVQIPVGEYRLLDYIALKKDAEGDVWRVSARGTPVTSKISLSPEAGAKFAFGEPFSPHVRPGEWRTDGEGDGLRLSFVVTGQANEQVSDLLRIEGDKSRIPRSERVKARPKEAAYKITDAADRVVSSGKFEYG